MLESKNPNTGKLFTLNDLNVLKMQNVGTGMLEDGIFSNGSWLKDKTNQDIAVRFLKASFQGWIYCRDHWKQCVNITLGRPDARRQGHQTWQMNEINELVWPNPCGHRDHERGRVRPDGEDRAGLRRDQEGAVGRATAPTWRRRRPLS